jgi:hypothetical protein
MIKGLRSFNRDTGFEYKILSSIGSWGPTSLSPDKSTVLIVDPSPLRNLGLIAALDRLSGAQSFASRRLRRTTRNDGSMRTPIAADHLQCRWRLGRRPQASEMDQGLRARAAEAQLVILSDNDSCDEIFSALTQNRSSVPLRSACRIRKGADR